MKLKKGLSALCVFLILAMTACDTSVPSVDTATSTEAPTDPATAPESEAPTTPESESETESETEGEPTPDTPALIDGTDYRVSEHPEAVEATDAPFTVRFFAKDGMRTVSFIEVFFFASTR